jgi:hypothetical protein
MSEKPNGLWFNQKEDGSSFGNASICTVRWFVKSHTLYKISTPYNDPKSISTDSLLQ